MMTIQMTLTTLTTAMKINQTEKKSVLIVLGAGSSSRMKGVKKEYAPFQTGTVLSTNILSFFKSADFDYVIVTYPFKEDSDLLKKEENLSKEAVFCDSQIQPFLKSGTQFCFIPGSTTRQKSVFNALCKIDSLFKNESPLIFIHDGARPFVTKKIILDCKKNAIEFGGAAPGIPPIDTQKQIDSNNFIKKHLVRSKLISIQTPQVFDFSLIYKAHKKADKSKKEFTDDTEIFDSFIKFKKVKIVEGDISNKKITFKDDLKDLNKEN